ncbi:LOW QUALITY PROTEIN: uncharacterized protein LOC114279888 [Camellia sinensis]|uniref:LOW QUALITY PROTEIN: uncharacterized protein LOC114279888 n=1 Tax=Camellia sinensis TaxID=4442 RepID=UPI001036750F|nr:LOW QUALITY PROTEIN: uncharacterized protein LOC114279888 [Camellia sinensis]
MLEDQVASLLQRYLGNYVRGLNKEALKISVWKGDVELTNMQLKPEALNALKLPVKVKAGFLGSVKLKVPWSRLGQDPVLVSLDRIFLLAEPATQVEGCSEDAVQEVKKSRILEMEMKLLESRQLLKSEEMNKSWLGSLIDTIIGNLKLSISNIHIRYEDLESNPGHPFAAGVTLERLSAVTVDDNGTETFVTGGALDRIQKSVELEGLAVYLDSDCCPWHVDKPWEDLLPEEWRQVFKFGTKDGKPADSLRRHTYVLQPVTGNAKYSKLRPNEFANSGQPRQKAAVNLDDVTLCLSKNGYRDLLKLADNFAAFNQRLKHAHLRPFVAVKSDPRSWWKYAYKAVSDEMKKASGRLSWEQVLRYASLRKKYISLYASLLKSDPSRAVVDDNKEIEELDRELDIDLILQWRMLAHKFVEQSMESDLYLSRQKSKKSWWSFGWSSQSDKDKSEPGGFNEEDREQLNKIIGYKEDDDGQFLTTHDKGDVLHISLEVHMRHNASKLTDDQECLAELSCDNLDCFVKLYPEAKVFDVKLGSYQLSSPNGLLAESATAYDSLVGVFCYKPFDAKLDWSMVAKASPCYVTYLKDSIDRIISFFESNTVVSQAIAMETAAAVQMTIDGVKRTAQQQVNRALKDRARFLLDLDIAAPKITIPTEFCPDNNHSTKLLIDLGNLIIRSQDDGEGSSPDEINMYLQFDLILSDVSAFLVDGDYSWSQISRNRSAGSTQFNVVSFLPVIDKCGVILELQQIRSENPSYPSTRLAVRLPSLGFHFSPARYHRLMQVVKIFQQEDNENADLIHPWNQADFEGWLSVLTWKGVGNREAVWQRRYLSLVGPGLYVLESPDSTSYKQYLSLRGKQLYQVPAEMVGDVEHVLAVCDPLRSNNKVVEDVNALILRYDSDESRRTWQNRLQGAIYRASVSAPITGLSETSSDAEDSGTELVENHGAMDMLNMEKVFITGVLDELKICFNYNRLHNQSFMKVLLAEESRLFEFRAIGGQVELSIRENDMFIGTVLNSLEIEDLVCRKGVSQPCYLARSFIRSTDATSGLYDAENRSYGSGDFDQCEGDDNFFEASENLNDSVDSPMRNISAYLSSQGSLEKSLLKPPSFTRVAGLLPDDSLQTASDDTELADTLDSFVKAQIIIYDQNSRLYHNIDKWVTVTLATLSFFCRRPTILAIMEFVNAINIQDESCESCSDNSSAVIVQHDISSEEMVDNCQSTAVEEPMVKGLLGKGKSRIVFYLTLKMARAEILLMNENGSKLATLSQDNLLTDIKVFPSSFSIKAALGNLRISDDSLHSDHIYFWVCDMRNPGGSSFVELVFSSFSADDEDYEGYDYSLSGQLSEVRFVYLNRFIQEIVSYFMGLVPNVPNNSKDVVKIKDQVTNSEKWFTTSEIEGSPAVKLDLSLSKPIILMPRRTDSLDYLKLDIVHITVQNIFKWFCGSKSEMNAVHMEILSVLVEDINLNVGTGTELGESIIQDVKGVTIVIQRSLRDLLHQIPSMEVAVKIEKLKAALSNREYQIITECALSNISETPNIVPALNYDSGKASVDMGEPLVRHDSGADDSEAQNRVTWIAMKISVDIDLVELCLHYGTARDATLATVQISGAWLLYKSNTLGEGFLSASLKDFSVIDDREGTEQALRLAVGKPESFGYGPSQYETDDEDHQVSGKYVLDIDNANFIPTMLILDAKFGQYSTSVSVCVQRPQLLVALDFLLAVVEFFVPSVHSMLSNEEDENFSHIVDAVILDQPNYSQPSAEFSLSPRRPLVVDDERFDHYVYDGRGGTLYLQDKQGCTLSSPSTEPIIYVGNGKRLQLKNIIIKNGWYLDSCIVLGTNSSYSASEYDQVYFEGADEDPHLNSSGQNTDTMTSQNIPVRSSTEFIVELQAIGPELTFYNASKDVGESLALSNKLLHAQLDAFCRLVLKGDTMEMSANALGFMMESNGIRILEPFDTSMKFSNASGKINIHFSVSDIFMNFSFSILRLFLAVEEDILAFLRTTSKKMTLVCSQFDKVGTIENPYGEQVFAFWRPHAPPGFAVLGDYLTPLNKPPTKGVLAVNTSLARVKRPVSFKLVWPPTANNDISEFQDVDNHNICSIWFPEAPKGYVALGCVVSTGRTQPPLSSAFCILASLVSPCALRDCVTISSNISCSSSLAFWRVDNSVGTFLPADPSTLGMIGRAYELRHIFFGFPETSSASKSLDNESFPSDHAGTLQSDSTSTVNSGWRFEAVASFRLIWWNQGSGSRKKLSIWRPIVPEGMVYFGDISVQGYEPPNTCIVLRDSGDDDLFKPPLDFQLTGQIKKHRHVENISFWLPQAPPGFVSLGCVACKGTPKQSDFSSLRCLRSDMVTGDQFLEESVWDTSDAKFMKEPFSIWIVGNQLGTFVVRSGFKKPPRRFALKLADPDMPSGSDDTVIDAEIGTFSAALFDDYGGLMVPLFNISLSGIGFSLHGRPEYLNSTVSFSLAARSYNDKYEAWEPLVEPVDGFLRYQYDHNAPGAASQLRLTCTRDLNLNVSVSNANMLFQAYASWNNLSHVDESYREKDVNSPTYGGGPFIDVRHRRDYYIIPQNKLGQDIFIRATEVRGLQNIIKMPSGDMKPIKVPVLKNMLESHLKGHLCKKLRTMVTIIIAEAEFHRAEGLSSHQYSVAVRLSLDQSLPGGSLINQQSARTCGTSSDHIASSGLELVKWNEIFFFRVDSVEGYTVELTVTDMGKGDPVGYFSASLKEIARTYDHSGEFTWIDLSPAESMKMTEGDQSQKSSGRIKCSVLVLPRFEVEDSELSFTGGRKSGFIQISPAREGPWTTVRLNYAAPAACWRLGYDVVASEVSIKDGNRYVNIRSLVSVRNNTDFTLDVCLKLRGHEGNMRPLEDASKSEETQIDVNRLETDVFFETEKYNPTIGWGSVVQPNLEHSDGVDSHQGTFGVELPSGWQWVDDWHIDKASVNTTDGWIYAPDLKSLKWPKSHDPIKFVNYARQRRWIRNRKHISGDVKPQIFVGQLKPGDTVPLPLSGLTHSALYILQLRPLDFNSPNEYSWSSVMDWPGQSENSGKPKENSEICVSTLNESEELLYCSEMSGTSSNSLHGMWFCLSIQATEIAKDIHSDPIQDWSLVVKSPLSITNYLPLKAEFSVLEMQAKGHFLDCSRGVFCPGKTVKVYNADIRKPLYFSLLPQRGWLPVNEAVLISHPSINPSKTISLRSSISGRVVQIILEQNHDKERPLLAKIIRLYSPYWFAIARCPPLTLRLFDTAGTKQTRKIPFPFLSKENNVVIFEEITEEDIYEGYTIASVLNFKLLSLSVSVTQSGREGRFGPPKDLSPLGDMDGSLDICAYDADGNCLRLFISSKPCPHQSVPTKVISVRPFVTFTNRIGQDIYMKLSIEDEPKILRASDSRVSFVYREASEPTKLQVQLENTKWSFPVQIMKEGTISLVLRKHDGARRILRAEIRGYEEGSRFIVVFRLGSTNGPIRLENRTINKTISIRQSGFGDDTWVQLEPLSTTNFSWEDPYGQRFIDAKIHSGSSTVVCILDLDKAGSCSLEDGGLGLSFHVVEVGDIKVARFTDDRASGSSSNEVGRSLTSAGNWKNSHMQRKTQENAAPFEIIVELGVVGVSVIDHRPKELSYLYLERVFISYSTGYDSGTASRFKLILGHLQLDNQLPLTLMPVMLAPEQTTDMHHPVFKMTITIRNENPDDIQIYPYVYIRVTEKCWRLNIHEPIIWAFVDFYNNLQLDRVPQSSSVTQVDPEIRIDLIDVSEVRLKVSLETAPAQRPHGVLGVWSPVLSAVGNAFKIQVHLRRVMHRDRFMRKSSVIPAIGNRIWRDLIHNPLHLIFSIDVLGMTSSTLASLSKGFAELSTDGQFLQLRSKQVWSRRITGVGDGIMQGTEALAQGVAFGVSGVVTKPMESARQNGLIGLAHGLGRAFLGIIVQPVSGALDFFSLTVDGIGASCSRCIEVLNNKATLERIRNPRAIHSDNILREYCEREALGQMILCLAEASRHFGCTEIFKEPSKFAWTDYYEDHFIVPYQRIVLVTNKRVMLLQCLAPDKMDKKPCKIMWDVPWEQLLTVELAKAGCAVPSHLILHLKTFRRSEVFVQVIKCSVEEELEGQEPQAVRICSTVCKMWKAYQSHTKSLTLKVPSSQRYVCFAWSQDDKRDPRSQNKAMIKSRKLSSSSSLSEDRRFVKHTINFLKVWSSEQELKGRCTLCRKKVWKDDQICSIWRPVCPDGYVSVGDVARVGIHPPNVAAVYHNSDKQFALPVGYDLVWRNCPDDYATPVSIWHPRAPEGFVSPGCVVVPNYTEPESDSVYCVAESLAEETVFEDQKIWSAPDSYPWACHIYQVKSDSLHFVGLRRPREESDWRPMRVHDDQHPRLQASEAQ